MKYVGIITVIVFALAVYFFMGAVEIERVLNEEIIPMEGTTEEWLEIFRTWATAGIAVSALAAFLWFVLGQWVFKVNDWREGDKRKWWGGLLAVTVIMVAVQWFMTPRPQEGMVWTYAFYLLNNVATFYLATLFGSPSSFKYTPLGASQVRRWKLGSGGRAVTQ